MADRTLSLGVETDDASLNRAKKRLEDIERAQSSLRSEFLSGAKVTDTYSKEFAKLEKEARELNKVLNLLEKPREIDVRTERFDQTSRDVALAGDVESNLRTVGGAIGAFGGAGAEGAIGKGAELFAVVEALPRLKEAAAGLPQTISAAGAAIGTSGAGFVGVLGVAAVAIGAVALAFKKFNDDAKKQADELNAVANARRDVAQDIAGGLSSDDALARINELMQLREAETEILERQKRVYDENISSQNALLEGILRVVPQEQALADQIKTSETAVQGYDTELKSLQTALEDGTLAANDAAQAERDLAAERTQGILTDAAQVGELATQRERLLGATREQIDAELQGLEVRKAGLEAELAALQASGDTSEEVQNRIAQLTETIGFLGEQATQLNSLREGAKTDKQVQAEKALAAAREDTAKAATKAAQSESSSSSSRFARRRADSARSQTSSFSLADALGLSSRSGQGADEQRKAAADARKKVRDINQQFQDDLLEAETDFNREREKEARRAEFELAKIGREAKRAEQEAVRERNFATAADAREVAADRQQDFKDEQAFEEREREIAYREQQIYLQRNQERQLREVRNALEQRSQMEVNFAQNSLNIWGQYFNRLIQMQQQATGTTGGRTGGNQNTLFNNLSYIQN